MENRFLDFKLDKDIDRIQQDALQGRAQVNLYQVFVGSTCNGTCVTCGSHSSSAWRRLEHQNKSTRQENASADQGLADWGRSINWAEAKRFNILGGEPLLMERSFDILRKLLAVGNTQCRVSFVTNGSVALTDEQVSLVKNFSDISCCVSIDGLAKTFEYIRYPLSWSNVQRNLDTYRDIFTTVEVSFTISNLNYHERDQTLQWFRDRDLLFIENYVNEPKWFHYQVDPNHPLWGRFMQEIKRQDTIKGIKIQDYLPYVANLMKS